MECPENNNDDLTYYKATSKSFNTNKNNFYVNQKSINCYITKE